MSLYPIALRTALAMIGFGSWIGAQTTGPITTIQGAVQLVSSQIDDQGPRSTGSRWDDRKEIFDFLDAVMHVPAQVTQHPLADPIKAAFIAALHENRIDRTIQRLGTGPAATSDRFRLHKLYSSSWILETSKAAIAIDFSTGFFYLGGHAGFRLDQTEALADRLDAYLISHPHPDHYSPQLIMAMLLRGKPVFVTQQTKTAAVASGSMLAPLLSVATPGVDFSFGDISFKAFLGNQYLGFLDPAQTIPNPLLPATSNNVYLLRVAGLGILHAGDNNDVAALPWVASTVAAGESIDILLNTGSLRAQLLALTGAPRLFQSHDLEMTHLSPFFIDLNLPLTPDPLRTVLMWGESFSF